MFFQKKMNREEKGSYEINMTPLIDVSLVLVVMLLLATPLALESSLGVRNSKKSARAADEKSKQERVEINIVSENTVRINRTTVARADMIGTLGPLLEASSHRLVVVSCSDSVSHGAFVDVLDQSKVCGASDIAVMGE